MCDVNSIMYMYLCSSEHKFLFYFCLFSSKFMQIQGAMSRHVAYRSQILQLAATTHTHAYVLVHREDGIVCFSHSHKAYKYNECPTNPTSICICHCQQSISLSCGGTGRCIPDRGMLTRFVFDSRVVKYYPAGT